MGVTRPENIAAMITPKSAATSNAAGSDARRCARVARGADGAQSGWMRTTTPTVSANASVRVSPGSRLPAKSLPMLVPV